MTKKIQDLQWVESKHYHEAGTEMFGKEFFAQVTTKRYLEDYELSLYSFVVTDENNEIYYKSNAEFTSVDEAKIQAEDYLDSAVKDFARKIGCSI